MSRKTHDDGHVWLTAYKKDHAERLRGDPAFARWLETEYVPIAGGWQY